MPGMKRRTFLKGAVMLPAVASTLQPPAKAARASSDVEQTTGFRGGTVAQYHIQNDYSLCLPGEAEALAQSPRVRAFRDDTVDTAHGSARKTLAIGQSIGGWRLVAIVPWLNGIPTAVFERHATHQGAISYVTQQGEIAHIPKRVGELSRVSPRRVNAPSGLEFKRPISYTPGPDELGRYVLSLPGDPCYESVAALGPEYTGWVLVANEEAGPEESLWLEPDGVSRQFKTSPQLSWAPDHVGRFFDPRELLPAEYAFDYVGGFSKRTMLGGYLPVADIAVWNPNYHAGYEVMVALPAGKNARPVGRVRSEQFGPDQPGKPAEEPAVTDRYWNGSAAGFYSALVGVWNRWHDFFDQKMTVEIPDEWLLDAARAGIVLSRCSYRGLNPTYQIGEGAYTKIPERSHALFPVAHYEFVWAHQLWNLTEEVEPYFEHYLDNYILPDGNFLYNTQDQVEAPLDAGIFLENSARAYDYTHDAAALGRRLPVLRRMIDFVVKRYEYSKRTFPPSDPRHGLIWGSPEADNGEPDDDYPESHPYYYQNASWTWRGLNEQARCLALAGREHGDLSLRQEAEVIHSLAAQMRSDIQRSLAQALAARNPAMKAADITPFTPFDTTRKPSELSSYENHRYMMDWWTSDWGDAALDDGHFKHRILAGEQILGMNTDGAYPRTSNFMAHGTLAYLIRQPDYRPFLLTLYALCCYTMDCGSRYSPEDALLPGSYAGEGNPYGWSAVVNSELQPALGLRWLLCYEDHDRDVVHLQKAAPAEWFSPGQTISVNQCPTRFGRLSWTTTAAGPREAWAVHIEFATPFSADLVVHIHPPGRKPLRQTSAGELNGQSVKLPAAFLAGRTVADVEIS